MRKGIYNIVSTITIIISVAYFSLSNPLELEATTEDCNGGICSNNTICFGSGFTVRCYNYCIYDNLQYVDCKNVASGTTSGCATFTCDIF